MALAANNARGMIKRGSVAILSDIPVQIDPPTTEQLTMEGGEVRYHCAVNPTGLIRRNDLLFITSCPSNPALVSTTVGMSCSQPRHEASITGDLSVTLFFATAKDQP